MFITTPQSQHFVAARHQHKKQTDNLFDWELYYRYKSRRDDFWLDKLNSDKELRAEISAHFVKFTRSVKRTNDLLANEKQPKVLDIGLSSEQLDKYLMKEANAKVTVIDVQEEARAFHERCFGNTSDFLCEDVNTYATQVQPENRFDLVFSVGLVEHYPDKSEILRAHALLTKPGGIVLLYAPTDSPMNRKMNQMSAEWENFGYRELLTPDELAQQCTHPMLEPLETAEVGFFSALWAKRL